MRRIITRHEIDLEFVNREIVESQDDIEGDLQRLQHSRGRIGFLFDDTVRILFYRCAVDQDARYLETWESVTTAMQVGSVIFAAAQRDEGRLECMIAHKIRHVPATGPQSWADPDTWLMALWLTMICRERERSRMLAQVPVETMFSTGGESDEYVRLWIEALQAYWRYEDDVFDQLLPAMHATDPERLHVASEKSVLFLHWPVMKAFSYLIQGKSEEFNAALAEAVDLHKDFWSGDAELAAKPDGFVALAPLALACLARDQELPVEVESDYLPRHLVSGEWLGEFPT